MYWNPRGITHKEEHLKEKLAGIGALYAGISESQTYKAACLSDSKWRWNAGVEQQPKMGAKHASRGFGALTENSSCRASVVFVGDYTMWTRVELGGNHKPLVYGLGYFPNCNDIKGHQKASGSSLLNSVICL